MHEDGLFSFHYEWDVALSALLGAQMNRPEYTSNGSLSYFGPWERAREAIFFKGPFCVD
eukprot:SAG31_NODE_32758_length_352_cov_0.604743_1_plen_58_part_10